MSDIQSKSSVSGVQTRKSVENIHNIDLIGKISHQIIGTKLPSNRQVMQVFFYNMRFVDRNKQPEATAKNSAKLAIDAAKIFWHQARIPIRSDVKCVEKVIKLYNDWKTIRKKDHKHKNDLRNHSMILLMIYLTSLVKMHWKK